MIGCQTQKKPGFYVRIRKTPITQSLNDQLVLVKNYEINLFSLAAA